MEKQVLTALGSQIFAYDCRTQAKQLNQRLQQLIDKNTQGGNLVKLEKRMKQIQNEASA